MVKRLLFLKIGSRLLAGKFFVNCKELVAAVKSMVAGKGEFAAKGRFSTYKALVLPVMVFLFGATMLVAGSSLQDEQSQPSELSFKPQSGSANFLVKKYHQAEQDLCTTKCHEMAQISREYGVSKHGQFSQHISCGDCHIEPGMIGLAKSKLNALLIEVPRSGWVLDMYGDKFEEERYHMAEHVWHKMQNSDSITCRKCHDFQPIPTFIESVVTERLQQQGQEMDMWSQDTHFSGEFAFVDSFIRPRAAQGPVMDLAKQRPYARKSHAYAITKQLGCISCHVGVGHKVPDKAQHNGPITVVAPIGEVIK